MITFIAPLAIGNAVKTVVDIPSGTSQWRLLRRPDALFAGPDDPDAITVYEGMESMAIDTAGLLNGTTYWYQAYYRNGVGWSESGAQAVIPVAGYTGDQGDPQVLMRDRLRAGIENEITRGELHPGGGKISVLTAPPQWDETRFPVVSVHLDSDAPGERGVGESIGLDHHDVDASIWIESEGWLARVALTITGWSLNPDERIALRRTLKRLVLGNFPVLTAAGWLLPEFSQQDIEDFSSFPAPVYQTVGTLTCIVPTWVESAVGEIESVEVNYVS